MSHRRRALEDRCGLKNPADMPKVPAK